MINAWMYGLDNLLGRFCVVLLDTRTARYHVLKPCL